MKKESQTNTILWVIAVLLVLSGWIGISAIEAAAFNSATGKNISTFEAMFISLRVQEGATP